MDEYSVTILDLSRYRDLDIQARVSVPSWFLDLISDAEFTTEVDSAIEKMWLSDEDELCKRKSVHLATVRKKVIINDSED